MSIQISRKTTNFSNQFNELFVQTPLKSLTYLHYSSTSNNQIHHFKNNIRTIFFSNVERGKDGQSYQNLNTKLTSSNCLHQIRKEVKINRKSSFIVRSTYEEKNLERLSVFI